MGPHDVIEFVIKYIMYLCLGFVYVGTSFPIFKKKKVWTISYRILHSNMTTLNQPKKKSERELERDELVWFHCGHYAIVSNLQKEASFLRLYTGSCRFKCVLENDS